MRTKRAATAEMTPALEVASPVRDVAAEVYQAFLQTKARSAPSAAVPGDHVLSSHLFPFQRDIVAWALRKGRVAVWSDCGTGKGPMLLEWARHVAKAVGPVLVAAPLAVAQQLVREADKFQIPGVVYRRKPDGDHAITVTNYEMLEHFDASKYAGVVCDECFAPGTMIDTPDGPRAIETLRAGDQMINAAGVDEIADVHRREVPHGIRIRFGSNAVISSPNHPYLTHRGWVAAQDLQPGDRLVNADEAVRLVRSSVPAAAETTGEETAILREVLLSEMADAPAGDRRASPHDGGSREDRREGVGLVQGGQPEGRGVPREDRGDEPDVRPSESREGLPPIERDEARTFRAWWKREGYDGAAIAAAGGAGAGVGSRVRFFTGATGTGLSDLLQAGLGRARAANRHRGGWDLASLAESAGREEGCADGFTRVDGLEVLEPGHPDMARFRDADGKFYFYDLGGTRHPSFSVGGALVHNSSILKAFDGKTRNQLVQSFANTPHRLACTATPAPNDHMELGNHAEFLGVMTRTEMLATYFTHDGGDTAKWRLKGHAEKVFWQWVGSWAVMIRKPSDLGYDDGEFVLPPLVMHEHVVKTPSANAAGMLFAMEARTLEEQRRARRASLAGRVAECAKVVNASAEPWTVWCELNDEGDALEAAIDGAVQVAGSDSLDEKERKLTDFIEGRARVLVTKCLIAGLGLNLQHCCNTAFVGLSNSFEQTYQAIRRHWRFGQTREVNAHVFIGDLEGRVVQNIKRKEADAERMAAEMVKGMAEIRDAEVRGTGRTRNNYQPTVSMEFPYWLESEGA